jgi:hypothetical protein
MSQQALLQQRVSRQQIEQEWMKEQHIHLIVPATDLHVDMYKDIGTPTEEPWRKEWRIYESISPSLWTMLDPNSSRSLEDQLKQLESSIGLACTHSPLVGGVCN